MSQKYYILIVIPFLLFAGTIEQEFSFSSRDLTFTQSYGYDVVRLKGCTPMVNVGEPELVTKTVSVLIPPHAILEDVQVVYTHRTAVAGKFSILPAQLPQPFSAQNELPFVEPDPHVYEAASAYPSTIVRAVHTGTKGGYRIATITVHPLQYIPKKKELFLYTDIVVEIIYREGAVATGSVWKEEYERHTEMVKDLVVNPEYIDVWKPLVKECNRTSRYSTNMKTTGFAFDNPMYAIMVADGLEPALEPLRDWKTRKGVPTEIYSLSWILGHYSGADDAEHVRNFIIDYHQNHGTCYFLCVGDYADFPMEGLTDFYYQDYDDDYYSDVYVGRASVSTVEEAETFVHKAIQYERNPASIGFHEKLFLPAYYLWANYGSPVNDTIAAHDPGSWFDAKRYWYMGYLSSEEISDSFNVGFAYTNISSHGTWDGWGNPGHNNEDADALINAAPYSGVITAISCLIGQLNQTTGDCYAEHMLNNPDGGPAAFWANISLGYGRIENKGRSEWLCIWFYEELTDSNTYNIGQTCAASKDRAAAYAMSDGSAYHCMKTLTLYGDPEMVLWSFLPRALEVTHAEEIDPGYQTFDVTVEEDGVPVQDAFVCLYNETDAIYETGYTNSSGMAHFSISPYSGNCDTLYVTVTKENVYVPYVGYALIGPGPFVIASSWIIDDAKNGNGDGAINPGESIDFRVWAKNIGRDIASGVSGMLTTTDPYVHVDAPYGRYGRITVGDSSLPKPYYEFSIANNCRYGHVIRLDLEYRDRKDTTWLSHAELFVHAPAIVYNGSRITNDNNDDTRLELDETGDLIITLANNGDIVASSILALLQTESPYVRIDKSLSYYGTCDPGNTIENTADPFTITFTTAMSITTEIDFSLIVMSGIYRDTFNFTVPVYPPDLRIQDVQVVNDENSDGALEPGEIGELLVTIENKGSAAANNITAVLRTASEHVTIIDSTSGFGMVAPGNSGNNAADHFRITSDTMTPYFSENDFTVQYTSSYVDAEDFTFHIGKFPLADNTGRYFAFCSADPHVQAPVFEWIAIDSTQTDRPGTWLQLSWDWMEIVDLPFIFTFYGREHDQVRICTNGLIALELRGGCWKGTNQPIPYADGGWPECDARGFVAGVWDEHLCPYNYGGMPGYMYYYYDEPDHRFIIEYWGMRHHGPIEYETFEIILYDPAYHPTPNGDGEILVQYLTPLQPGRTSAWSCGNTVGVEDHTETVGIEWYYAYDYNEMASVITDSFAIKYTAYPKGTYPKHPDVPDDGARDGCAEFGSGSEPLQTMLFSPCPNPFRKTTVLKYQIADVAKTKTVSLKIYDIAGRLVKHFDNLTIQPFNQVTWDGFDTHGRAVSSGVYFVHFETDDHTQAEKIILLR